MKIILSICALITLPPIAHAQSLYQKDIDFALTELPKQCGSFFELKKINWAAISEQFRAEAKRVTSDEEHLRLLIRLLARLKDGHASVRPLEKGKSVPYPNRFKDLTGPGFFLCLVNDKVIVKNNVGASPLLKPGSEILTVNGIPARQWVNQRLADWSDTSGFSTDHQALAWTCHWGMAGPVGETLRIDFQQPDGKRLGALVKYKDATYVPRGPAVFPPNLQSIRDLRYGKLESGQGYIHLRRCPANLPEQIDQVLAEIGNVPGLILDLRANGGGGFDHEALMGRFIPKGKSINFNKPYTSSGPHPYGGPIVVIIDANTRSAGETLAAIFKEDGRAYLIGETPTAGMSSSKTTIDLPSQLFSLYVSIHSNMSRSNNGKGIEGIGIPPHEIVPCNPKDLANNRDTQILRAQQILEHFPQEKVPYDPSKFDWHSIQ